MESGVKKEDKTDLLPLFLQQFDESADQSQNEREDAELSRKYVDHRQYTDEEITALQARGQPVITDNKIKDKVEYLEGLERQTRTDPKAWPRTPQHVDDADVATEAIRFVFDRNNFPQLKSRVFNNLLVEGMGGAEVIVDKKDPRKIEINYCRWDRLYYDPYSMDPDFKDAQYVGLITWMDADRAKKKYPKNADKVDMTMAARRSTGETHDDKPRYADTKRKRVQVFEHYAKVDGTIMRAVFVQTGFLEEPAECPYVNDEGEHEWPLILQSAYVDFDGNRYGVVKRYRDLQDEVNKRRSKSLHLLNSKQMVIDKGAFDDVNKARRELHKPDGVLEKMPGTEVEIIQNLDLSAGQFQLLQQAENALALTGPNAALLGQGGAQSGRAKQIDQQGGAVQLGVHFDAIRYFQKRVAQAVWSRIRQYWDQEIWIRVTDDDKGQKFVALNQPVMAGDAKAEALKGAKIPAEEKRAILQQIAQDPQAQMPVIGPDGKPKIRHAVAMMDMDIVIDEAPDVINLQQEQFTLIAELAKTRPEIPIEAVLELSAIHNKKKVIDLIKGGDEGQPQITPEMQQQMQQLEEVGLALQEKEKQLAEVEKKLQAESSRVMADDMGLTAQQSDLKVQRAELKAQEAKLREMEANFRAQQAETQLQIREQFADQDTKVREALTPQDTGGEEESANALASISEQIAKQFEQQAQMFATLLEAVSAPKRVSLEFGQNGRPSGATVTPDVSARKSMN
ncbi:MAG: hypothetical protein IT178_16555 [Acidobacteria bacterium]|nr:hypothetical protein [Acidobacteriota bacterium]